MKKNYSDEFKTLIVSEFFNGESTLKLSEKYHIARSTIYEWTKSLKKIPQNTKSKITYRDHKKLQRQLEKKTRELVIIVRTHCFKDSPRKQKLEAVEQLYGEYPTKEMCRVINLDHGTFLNHHIRRVKVKQNEIRDEKLKVEIQSVFEKSEQRFGSMKIYHKLQANGIQVSQAKIASLMNKMGLKSKQCKKRNFVQKEELRYNFLKNKLNRQFQQLAPNKFWVSDTSCIKIGRNNFWLCVIIDLFSRKVIAHRISSQNNVNLTINTFKDSYENRGRPEGLSFHSDRGNNYIAVEFRELLSALKVGQSCSKTGNPYDNAVMESFFSNIKREELNSHNFAYLEELIQTVDKYMLFYNDYRPHDALKGKTPNQIEKEFVPWTT